VLFLADGHTVRDLGPSSEHAILDGIFDHAYENTSVVVSGKRS
jgi:hypothetical protein